MDEMKNEEVRSERKKRSGVILLILLLLILVGVGVFIAWKISRPVYNDRLEPNAVVGSMPGKSAEQIAADLTQQVKETEVAFSINVVPVFETGTAKGNILFENPQSNKKLTRVELTLDETGEMLYKSGLLEPGSYVPSAKLLKDLEPGSYTCTATIFAYKLEDESYIGKVAAAVTVTVEG